MNGTTGVSNIHNRYFGVKGEIAISAVLTTKLNINQWEESADYG